MEHELECYRSDRPWVDRPMQVGPACLCDRLRAHGARVRADERTKAAGRVQTLIDEGPHYDACPHWGAEFNDMLEMVRAGIACECALIGDTYRDALATIGEAE